MFATHSLRNRLRPKPPPGTRKPQLEALEDRTVPALLNVTALTSGFTPTTNNYTLLNDALHAAKSGDVLVLSGNFDWTEPNAANSWALGSDATAGTNDDYFLVVPRGLDNVTLEAASPSGASIIGPGNRPATDLEGFLRFVGGTGDHNRGWTISNLNITGFNLSIDMFDDGGSPSNAFSDTQITNNSIQVATASNATAAGAPIVTPNVGILFGYGKNQRIANNTIDFAGDGLSDTSQNHLATSIGILSTTGGGGKVYDGLDIEGNTLRVLNAPSADPEHLVGIWENGNTPASSITIKNNQFVNLAAGNDPSRNVQFGFLVTSHSSGSTTVTYTGNTVQGANVAFDWASGPGVNFSGEQAVQLNGNQATNVVTAVVVQSGGSVLLQNNTFLGHGGTGTGVAVFPGSAATGSGNQVSGFLSGIDVMGSAAVSGATLTGNGVGLRVSPGGNLTTATGNTITGNTVGVLIAAGASSVSSLQFNTISSNTYFGIDNESGTTITATPVFWGDVTGPKQPALNPSGLGNFVSANVQFVPLGVNPNNFALVNVPPTLTALNLGPATINEGQSTSLTGTFTDPDTTQGHTLSIDWGDGSGTVLSLGAGQVSFGPVSHVYLDDKPFGHFTVTAKVTDDLGARDLKTVMVAVNDVPPTLGNLTANPTAPVENHPVTLVGAFNDSSPKDTFTLTVSWDDGSPNETFTLPAGTTGFGPRHVYSKAGVYKVRLSLMDANGGGFTAIEGVKVASATKVSSQRLFVESAFRDLLGRIPDAATLATLTAQLNRGLSRNKLALQLQQRTDYRVKVVKDLYLAILGRPATASEVLRQSRALARKETVEQLEAFLFGTDEFYGRTGDAAAFLQTLYRNAVGQEIDPGQQATFLAQLQQGVSRSTVAARVLASQAGRTKQVNDLYQRLLLRPATPGELAAGLSLLRRGHRDLLIAAIVGSKAYFNLL